MTERPILFNQPMVRAILDGRKTVTRRLIKPQPSAGVRNSPFSPSGIEDGHGRTLRCPYGQPGDQLWVRETTVRVEDHGYKGPVYLSSEAGDGVLSWGLGPVGEIEVDPDEIKLRPSLLMPKSMARIWLEITDLSVERVQDGEGETPHESRYLAEGINAISHGMEGTYYSALWDEPSPPYWVDPFDAWWELWTSTGGDWDANPWVWVIRFKVLEIKGGRA